MAVVIYLFILIIVENDLKFVLSQMSLSIVIFPSFVTCVYISIFTRYLNVNQCWMFWNDILQKRGYGMDILYIFITVILRCS